MTPFTKLATDWLKIRRGHCQPASKTRYSYSIAALSRYVADLNGNLAEQVTQWETQRRAELSTSAFIIELQVLNATLKYGKEIGAVKVNPAEPLRAGRRNHAKLKLPTAATWEKIAAEVRRLNADAGDLFDFLRWSGVRIGEARRLCWCHCDFETGQITVDADASQNKTGLSRVLPMFPSLRTLLESVRARRPCELTDPVFMLTEIYYHVNKACDNLGVDRIRAHHDCRHCFCVNALKKLGMNKVAVVAKWIGHADVALLLNLYANHVDNPDEMACAEKMG